MIAPLLEKANFNKGWNAKLDLEFVKKHKKTVLQNYKHEGPLQVQKVFYPEENGTSHVYLLHPPGGVVGGDSFDIKILVNSNAKVLVTTPAAGKFYRSAGATAYQKQTIKVESNGTLEWFPSENIFFSGAKANLETSVELSEGSHFVGWDILCLGRPAIEEKFSSGQLTQRLKIFQNEHLIRLEKLVVKDNDPVLDAKWGLGGKPVIGSFFCITNRKELVDILRQNIRAHKADDLFSVTFLDDIILCRYLGNSVEQVKQSFIEVWKTLRFSLWNYKTVIPRIWNT